MTRNKVWIILGVIVLLVVIAYTAISTKGAKQSAITNTTSSSKKSVVNISAPLLKEQAKPNTSDSYMQAAEQGLKDFWDKISPSDRESFGFSAGVQLKDLSIGPRIAQTSLNKNLDEVHSGLYRTLVLYQDQAQVLLNINQHKNSWRTHNLGAAKLARTLLPLINQYSQNKVKDSNSNQLRLFRVHPLRKDFFCIKSKTNSSDRCIAIGNVIDTTQTLSPAEIIQKAKEVSHAKN